MDYVVSKNKDALEKLLNIRMEISFVLSYYQLFNCLLQQTYLLPFL